MMKKELTFLPEAQVKAMISKLEREIRGIKEEQKKIWKHQSEIEDRIKENEVNKGVSRVFPER